MALSSCRKVDTHQRVILLSRDRDQKRFQEKRETLVGLSSTLEEVGQFKCRCHTGEGERKPEPAQLQESVDDDALEERSAPLNRHVCGRREQVDVFHLPESDRLSMG
jgi:hypothetical protein